MDQNENEEKKQQAPETKASVSVSLEGNKLLAETELPENPLAEIPQDQDLTNDVVDQFKGLPLRELIAAPLIAACESQQQLAATALNFYKKIAYEDENSGKARTLDFELERPVQTPGGVGTSKIQVKAPFIGLVPVPSLLIDNIDIDFQMEITDSSTSKSSESAEFSSTVSAKWFTASVDIQGKVTSSRDNTRSTNQTAKYQIHVSASQQKQTEGLSKLMDIMASCVEPIETGKS
jgi:hypothetical protein